VSDFRRELLEPSATYQAASTSAPTQLILTTTKQPTDNLPKLKNDKRPFRNITAALKKSFKFDDANDQHSTNGHDRNGNHPNSVKKENLMAAPSTEGDTTKDGIKTAPSYTFYASREFLPKSRFVLHTSRDVLEYLQTWLGVAYPLTKLDFVALPSLNKDIYSSLGLISCRTSFLREPGTITTTEYHSSAIEISEAIVKQYFGGLISPKIWKAAWLWEGLIKYLSRYVLAPLQPGWPMEELQLMTTTIEALDIDALQRWDSISQGTSEDGFNVEFYVDKSAAILAMLNAALGEDNFRGCLGTFLTTHKYQTAEPLDLWQLCMKRINGTKNIKEMMNMWTEMAGFPLLNVTRNNASITIQQRQFQAAEFLAILEDPKFDNDTIVTTTTTTTTTPSPKDKKKKDVKWIFPVSYITNAEQIEDMIWLNTAESK
jgi:aminopeptidase N